MKKRPLTLSAIFTGVLVAGLLFFVSCNKDSPEPDNIPDLRTLSAEEIEVVQASNSFAFDMFLRFNAENADDNLFISPFSISTALSMTLNGAEGSTKQAMKEVLHQGDMSSTEINKAYRDLVSFLFTLDKTVILEVANSNWYRDDLSINESFKTTLLDYYDAEVRAADFKSATTLDLINGWIENETHGKIKDMLDQIPPDAVMYLINAIYFKADWQYQFDKKKTEDRVFHLSDGSSVMVPTMFAEEVKVTRAVSENAQLIELPYGNGQFRFSIVQPVDEEQGINEFIEQFDGEDFEGLLTDTASLTTSVYLPKFKIEFKTLLNQMLTDAGMGIAFSGDADFSNLFEEAISTQISRVIHQSFLEVNEEGSEAAAATIVEIVETAAPQSIAIDRPFLFFIRENHSGTILFSGKLMNPL